MELPVARQAVEFAWAAALGLALGCWYDVLRALRRRHPRLTVPADGLYCLTGLTQGQPGCADYYASQNAKLKKYRLGLPDGAEKDAVGALIAELDRLAAG